AGHRHRARWSTAGTERQLPLFASTNAAAQAADSHVADAGHADARPAPARPAAEPRIAIPPPSAFENTHADYASTGLSLDTHPVALVRRQLQQRCYCSSTE